MSTRATWTKCSPSAPRCGRCLAPNAAAWPGRRVSRLGQGVVEPLFSMLWGQRMRAGTPHTSIWAAVGVRALSNSSPWVAPLPSLQLMRSRSASSGKQLEDGSSPLQQCRQESGSESSQGREDGHANVHSGSRQQEQEEQQKQQQEDRQHLPQPPLPLQQQEQQPPQQREPQQEQQHSPQTPVAQLQQAVSVQLQQTPSQLPPAPVVHHPPVNMVALPLPLWATHLGANGGLQALPPAAPAVASNLAIQQPSLLQQAHLGMGGSATQAAHQAWVSSGLLLLPVA